MSATPPERRIAAVNRPHLLPIAQDPPVSDTLGRPLGDLRISVTDRCNFRCVYCMPRAVYGPEHPFLPRAELLSFEEIERLARIFIGLGVRKLRLTGGEPLLRRDLAELIRRLAPLGVPIALTTNGSLLRLQAAALHKAGLTRLTVSLDTLDPTVFRRMNDTDFGPEDVLDGIAAAGEAGFESIKVNAVVRRGVNEEGVSDLVRKFRGSGQILRFIEYMDVGESNGWRLQDVVPATEILQRVAAASADTVLEPVAREIRGEVANRYRFRDGSGEIGIISSVSQPFCGDCVRARLSADGKIFTCLFAASGRDIKLQLRAGASDAELAGAIAEIWRGRDDRYSELRSQATSDLPRRVEMSYIGG
ncbi:MAG: GTP 3',8-cyclase MoaA [Thermoanaerobaculia bacterium]